MRVDVLILGTPPNGSAGLGTQTKTLLQNMEVLSAGQQIERDKEGKPVSVPVVNMLVTPEQAEILSLASQDARIVASLPNSGRRRADPWRYAREVRMRMQTSRPGKF